MKKVIIIAAVLFVVMAVSASAWGIGIAAGIDPLGGLPGSNLMLSVKPPSFPVLFGVGFTVWENIFNLGIIADWWVVNPNLFSFVNFYIGPGLYLGINSGAGGYSTVNLGGRVPIGLNIFPLKWLELFIEIAPTLAVGFEPIQFPIFSLQGAFGIRFWFN
jgi:hypothetical protein